MPTAELCVCLVGLAKNPPQKKEMKFVCWHVIPIADFLGQQLPRLLQGRNLHHQIGCQGSSKASHLLPGPRRQAAPAGDSGSSGTGKGAASPRGRTGWRTKRHACCCVSASGCAFARCLSSPQSPPHPTDLPPASLSDSLASFFFSSTEDDVERSCASIVRRFCSEDSTFRAWSA